MLTFFIALGLIETKADKFYTTENANEHLIDSAEWNLIPYFSTQTERPIVKKMFEVLKTGEPASWGAKENEMDWEKAMERDKKPEAHNTGYKKFP